MLSGPRTNFEETRDVNCLSIINRHCSLCPKVPHLHGEEGGGREEVRGGGGGGRKEGGRSDP